MEGHQIELRDEPRRVEVVIQGDVIASSSRVIALHETGLPVRHYFPVEDVAMDLLDATPTETVCPFKGQASYWSVRGAEGELRDVAWSYQAPIEGMEAIAGRICFYAERTDHFIEGEPLGRPHSPWSTTTEKQ